MAVPRVSGLVGGGVGALFQDGAVVGWGSLRHDGCSWRCAGGGSGSGDAAFGVGLLQKLFGDLLGAAGVVIGLLGFAVFVDGAGTLAEEVKDFAEIDVAPDFGPLLGSLWNGLQGVAEGVGGGLVILLVEEGFAHAEIGERAIGLNAQGALVLTDSVVVAAL